MARERVSTYVGKDLTITYDRTLCIHAAECGRSLGDLFNTSNDPWCTPDAVAVDDAAEIVRRCPSGALTYARRDGEAETPPDANTIFVAGRGPSYIRGDLRVVTAEGETRMTRLALCRCGASKNKPFCDNSHFAVKFKDPGAIGERGDGIDAEGGELLVEVIPNGPVHVKGNVTLRAGSGRVAYLGRELWLCRCGASKNKPFCDGTHKSIGFTG